MINFIKTAMYIALIYKKYQNNLQPLTLFLCKKNIHITK